MPSRLDVTPAWRLRNGRNGFLLAKHAHGIGEDHERIRGQPLSIEVRASLPKLLLQRNQISRNVHIGPLEVAATTKAIVQATAASTRAESPRAQRLRRIVHRARLGRSAIVPASAATRTDRWSAANSPSVC